MKKQRHHFADKGPYNQSYGFSSSNVQMWELYHKEGWTSKNWYFWTLVLEKTLESPLDCKKIKPVNPKGNQPWIFVGNIDTEVFSISPIFSWHDLAIRQQQSYGRFPVDCRAGSDQIRSVDQSLWPHESQHARPPCPSPYPGVCLSSRPLN